MEPRASDCATLTTEDNGTPIYNGDRLFNHYDRKWGVAKFTLATAEDGWFSIIHDDGTKAFVNGVRVSTEEPQPVKRGRG